MKHILVVDDDPASRLLVREILGSMGYEIVEAGDGLEALECIRRCPPGLILLDIQMPKLDGFGVLREIRKDPRLSSIPVIALTACVMRGDREDAVAAGFDNHVSKPINVSALREQVKRDLG